MSILEHFDHSFRKQDKAHFKHLVQVALADVTIDESELKMLNILGRNMGLTGAEMDDLLGNAKKPDYYPPYKLNQRFKQLYDIVKMVLADGKIAPDEMHLTHKLALTAGFPADQIADLVDLLVDGIGKGLGNDELFALYKEKGKAL